MRDWLEAKKEGEVSVRVTKHMIDAHELICSNRYLICDPSALWNTLEHATRTNL